jgi:hypothetical protein
MPLIRSPITKSAALPPNPGPSDPKFCQKRIVSAARLPNRPNLRRFAAVPGPGKRPAKNLPGNSPDSGRPVLNGTSGAG